MITTMASRRSIVWISASICSGLVFLKNNLSWSAAKLPGKEDEEEEEYIDLPDIFEQLDALLLDDKTSKTENANSLESWLSKLELIVKLKNELKSLKIAQSSDYDQSVRLARSPGDIDLNQFRPAIRVDKILLRINDQVRHFELNELMVHLLKSLLEINHQSECANYLTRQTLVLFEQNSPLNDILFYQEYNHRADDFDRQLQRYKTILFQTILQNITTDEKLAKCLINNGLLVAFHKLHQLFPDPYTSRWIARCMAALSFYKDINVHFYHTGWIGILAGWLRGSDWNLKLEAAKTLFNMADKSQSLSPSMYLLWPIFDTESFRPDYDIIFIHGLKGGVLRTWRQLDTEKNAKDYTECWPKSWLAKDFKNSRILAVHYDSFLSNWSIVCSSQEFTIKDRSIRLVDELEAVTVGSKPIIWITHSMGGLLVKQMLTYCHDEIGPNHPLLNQTKGIVFYSVPHFGSEMAVWSQNIQRLISPSNLVLELRKDNPQLIELHRKFVEIVRKHRFELLSFGETEKCTLLKNPIKWQALLVPEESANPGIGKFMVLNENHFNICKPKDRNSQSYVELKNFVQNIVIKENLESLKVNKNIF